MTYIYDQHGFCFEILENIYPQKIIKIDEIRLQNNEDLHIFILNKTELFLLENQNNILIFKDFPINVDSFLNQVQEKLYLINHKDIIQYGHFILNFNNMSLTIDQKTEITSFKLLSLLEYGLKNSNQLLSKKHILQNLWSIHSELETHTLETHIHRLRLFLQLFDECNLEIITEKDNYIFKI